ncbi:MAG: UvrD-helicase domain-containing protein, partial [Myxococcales bacterium]|nr:UvrD-helicase domain-containing protein [Myxococcales bacterium]
MRPLRALEVPLHGLRLIEASAGTGKTFTITTLVLRLLLERALRIDQILVVTFTIAATAELRERIRARIRQALGSLETHLPTGDPALDALLDARRLEGHGAADAQRLREALSSFDLAPISTIHGFCRRTLQGHAFESGVRFDRKLITDSSEFLESVTRDFLGLHLYDAPEAIAQDLWEALRKTNLRDLVRKVSANPLLRILPDREIARSELLAASADLEARFQAAAGSWASARDAIETLLCEGGSLNGNSYRPSTIRQRWLPELDAYFGGGRPSDAPESLLKLTPATLLLRVNKGKRPPEHPFFELAAPLHEAVSLFLSLLREAALTLRLELVRYAREELPRRKAEAHVLSFDDLLQQLARALEGPGGPALGAKIRASYGAAMIDEFQDTDPIQYSIFERIYAAPEGDPSGGAALFQIGDPKQAIYAFRGADIFAYLEAKRRASGGGEGAGRAYTLDRNWRSDPSLLRALAEIFGRARDPFFFPQIEFVSVRPRPGARDRLGGSLEDQPALELLLPEPVPDEEPSDPGAKGKRRARSASLPKARPGISRLVAGEIAALLGGEATIDGRPIEPGDIAVLCKAHRELAEMRDELSRFGIPSVLRSRESIFESAEATDLCSLLQALVSPSDR